MEVNIGLWIAIYGVGAFLANRLICWVFVSAGKKLSEKMVQIVIMTIISWFAVALILLNITNDDVEGNDCLLKPEYRRGYKPKLD